MSIKRMISGTFTNSSFFNKRFLHRPLKANERINITIDKKYKDVQKCILDDYHRPIAVKSVFQDAHDMILKNEIKSDTYIGDYTKYANAGVDEFYFSRQFLKNGKIYKVTKEAKAHGNYDFSEATLENENVMTAYIKEVNLKDGKTTERTVKKYYNNAGQVVQTELYDKDKNFVQRNILEYSSYRNLLFPSDRVSYMAFRADGSPTLVENEFGSKFEFFSHICLNDFKH